MQTSNFSKNGKNVFACSIAVYKPAWYRGSEYPSLFPSGNIVRLFKNGVITWEEYTEEYNKNVLAKLNPKFVFDQLQNQILLCYCASDTQFCHRKLVANWIWKNLGIEVAEI